MVLICGCLVLMDRRSLMQPLMPLMSISVSAYLSLNLVYISLSQQPKICEIYIDCAVAVDPVMALSILYMAVVTFS